MVTDKMHIRRSYVRAIMASITRYDNIKKQHMAPGPGGPCRSIDVRASYTAVYTGGCAALFTTYTYYNSVAGVH